MNEQLNMSNLNELSLIGSTEGTPEIAPNSIFTSIVASIMFCTPGVVSAATAVSALSVATSALFSCTSNSAACG
jgi:hypothetical protein